MNRLPDFDALLRPVREAARELPREALPALIGRLGGLQAELLLAATEAPASGLDPPAGSEGCLDAREAARRLGVSEDWIRRHTSELPFVVRLGRKVRFSVAGLDRFIRLGEGQVIALRRPLRRPSAAARR